MSGPRRLLWVATAAASIGGCAVGPDYERPEVDLPDSWGPSGATSLTDAPRLASWWEGFEDPLLQRLIEEAASQNLGLQAVALRIVEARATLGIAAGNRFPQRQTVSGEIQRRNLSKRSPNFFPFAQTDFFEANVGVEVAWELDLWGRFRRSLEAAQGAYAASVAAYDGAMVSLLAETARAYIAVRTGQALLAITRENVAIQQRSLEIAEVLARNQRTTDLDVQQARTLLEATRADIPLLEAGIIEARNALSLLLGQAPGRLEARLGEGAIPQPPPSVALGIPADVLRQRPDVIEAELRAATQSARVGVAVAERLPSFALFGRLGLRAADTGSSELADLFTGDAAELVAGPGFSYPLLNYGRLKNAVRVEDARLQQALVGYQNTVLNAAREVEDAIARFEKEREALAAFDRSAQAARRAVDLALLQYREGIASYQRVLDTQRTLNAQQQLAERSRGNVSDRLVVLYKALGGGWELRRGRPVVKPAYVEQMRERVNWGDLLAPVEMPETPAAPPPAREQPLFGPPAL